MEAAARLFEEALEHKRQLNDNWGIANLLYSLGRVKTKLGELDQAVKFYNESRQRYDELGEKRGYAFGSHWLGVALTRLERFPDALEVFKTALEIRHGLEDTRGLAESFEGLAGLLLATGEHERSAKLLGAAQAIRNEVGAPLSPADQGDVEDIKLALETELGSAELQQWLDEGAGSEIDEICRLAFDDAGL